MKWLRFNFVLAAGLALAACSSEEMVSGRQGQDEAPPSEYLVSMDFTGEMDVSREPMTKSTPTNDL
jgi:hypothetical protein